ncbi:MAG: hypothetical protein RSD47_09020 [Romboutsia sp.]
MELTIKDIQLAMIIGLHCKYGITFKELSKLTMIDLFEYSLESLNLGLELKSSDMLMLSNIWLDYLKYNPKIAHENHNHYVFYSKKNTTMRQSQIKKILEKKLKSSVGKSYTTVMREHFEYVYRELYKPNEIDENFIKNFIN